MPSGRCGAAAVEKVVIATLVLGVLGPVAWVVGTTEMQHLSRFSSSLEQELSKSPAHASERSFSGQNLLEQPKFVSAKATSSQNLVEETTVGNSGSRVLWISLMSASLATIGLFWIGYSQRQKEKRDSSQSPDDLKESLRSLKSQLEKEMRPGCVFTKRQQTMKTLLHQFEIVNCQGLQIRHLLTRKVKTILPTTSVEELRELFTKSHYRHLLVCDAKQKLLGIITTRDLQRKNGTIAADFMTTALVTASPNQSVCSVISTMMEKRISSLPVIEDSQLIGILTSTDLLIALQCTLQILGALGNPSGDSAENQSCSIVNVA